ncbi:MAG: YggT family protein [Chloroflexi bacterium]|nr:YggT family protein [Chloroflexota bacterium]
MASLVSYLITFLIFAIFARVILDWLIVGGIMRTNNLLRDVAIRITEPILSPLRRYTRIGTIDLSPMVAIIILTVIQKVIAG